METEQTTKILRQWFDSWAKDDMATVIEGLAEDVTFYVPRNEYNQVIPYLGKRVGRQAVIEAFVVRSQTVELVDYELREFIVEGNKACILSHTRERCKQTQQTFEVEDAQFIELNDEGKIVLWSFYFDPNSEVAAFKADLDIRFLRAVQKDQCSEVQSLLAMGAHPNIRDADSGLTPLMIAAQRANGPMVKILLDAGADPHMLDSDSGTTVLHHAAQGGSAEVTQLLVDAGAFVNAIAMTEPRETPLHIALRLGHLACAEGLILAGADLNLSNGAGLTSLQIAVERLGSQHPFLEQLHPVAAVDVC
jgi:ketosteroid isomerase-like protein